MSLAQRSYRGRRRSLTLTGVRSGKVVSHRVSVHSLSNGSLKHQRYYVRSWVGMSDFPLVTQRFALPNEKKAYLTSHTSRCGLAKPKTDPLARPGKLQLNMHVVVLLFPRVGDYVNLTRVAVSFLSCVGQV